MSFRFSHIFGFLFVVLFSTGLQAQVYVGDGVTISEGTQFTIQNQELIIATDEIKGEGILHLQNSETQQITVHKSLKTFNSIQIFAEDVEVNGKFAQKFAAKHLPKLTEEVINAAKAEELEEKLPVRYINTEGLVYDIPKEEESQEPVIKSFPDDVSGGLLVSDVLRMQAADISIYYNLPIYSFTLNDERFSDYAELYEFESLTAILKPPIV